MLPADVFKCKLCGDCCRGYGGTHVSETDIGVIAASMGIDPKKFRSKFCQKSGERWVLAQGADGYCIFWDQVCSIHRVKPRMCRQWPFIANVLEDVTNWYRMAYACPGMRVDVTDEEIIACVKQAFLNEPQANIGGMKNDRPI